MQMSSETPADLTKDLPFQLKAEDFIGYAEIDIKENSERDIVNALSNIKRAIENRMDSILFAFKYEELAKDWNFPQKMERLNKLSLIAPRILRKINSIRNLLEHEYQIPQKEEVEEAYDVSVLFLAYTKNFIKRHIIQYEYYLDKGSSRTFVRWEFKKKHAEIEIDKYQKDKTVYKNKYRVEATNPNYDEWIKFTVQLFY